MDFAKFESKIARLHEIKAGVKRMKEEKEMLQDSLSDMMEKADIREHRITLNEASDVKITRKNKDKKIFEKEKFAEDLGAAVSEAQKKDFLINMAENKKLTLHKFKEYFHFESEVKLSVTEVKTLSKKGEE